ncbi:MAG: hypothetical protein WC376_00045 [Candidatus Nanoarchaeia archaeon]|jgi:hypothetical protein
MGVGTHRELCEYLLMTSYPEGLTYKGILFTLKEKGWSYDAKPEFGHDKNWIKENVLIFCDLIKSDTRMLRDSKKEEGFSGSLENFVEYFNQKKNLDCGSIYFNLKNDKKFKFYPGIKDTPFSWNYLLELGYCATDLSDQENWMLSDKKQGLRNRINFDLMVAEFYCTKFNMDFYQVCYSFYEKNKKEGLNVKPPSKKLRELTPEFLKSLNLIF